MDKLELARQLLEQIKMAAKYSLLFDLVGYGEIKERHSLLSSNE